jgi:hypothetical protein
MGEVEKGDFLGKLAISLLFLIKNEKNIFWMKWDENVIITG